MFVKAVHDRLNHDITEGSGGIWVENKDGDTWQLSGDKTLLASPDTLKYGKKAVDKARQAVMDAEGKDKLDYAAIAQTVWDLVPVPSAKGKEQIAEAEADLLDPKQVASSDAWIEVALDNLPTLLSQLTEKELIRV